MAHEITERDGLVLTGKPAWHGLGVVVEKAPSPREALRLAGLGWQVEQFPVLYRGQRLILPEGEGTVPTIRVVEAACPDNVANVRSDTNEVLGVVGKDFGVVQNDELAALIYEAAGTEGVTIESAGSLRGGRDVFFLAHLGTFLIGERDKSHTFALFVNGHDGGRALTVLPTSVRVVCANTLRAATSGAEKSRLTVALRHTSGIKDRLEDVRAVLRGAASIAKREEDRARALASRKMSPAEVERFFADVYVTLYGSPPAVCPATRGEKSKRTRAVEMAGRWKTRLMEESESLGEQPNAWIVANAVTGWIDHERTMRGGDRVHSNVLGSAAAAKDDVLALALATVK